MTKKRTESKYALLILSAVYKGLLDFMYVRYISVSYEFYGFSGDFSKPAYFFSWLVFILFSYAIIQTTYKTQTKFSSLLLFVFYLVYFVPFTSMFYGGYKNNFILYSILVWSFLVLYINRLTRHSNRIPFSTKNMKISRDLAFFVFAALTFLICLSVVYLSWRFTGFRVSFNEANTYVFRVQAFDYKTSALWGYLYSWSRLIIPILLCLAIVHQKYLAAVGLFALKMLGFGYDGMRLDLFITLIAVGTAILYRKKDKDLNLTKLFRVILLCMIGVCLLSVIEHLIFKTGEIDRVITFRVLFLPNLIASWFIKFFETHPPDFFRQSFLRYLGFESPYSGMGLDYIISDFILGDNGRANNGLVADCMTNFGILGFLIQPFVVAVWTTIIDKITKHVHISVILLMAIYFSYCLTNNFFTIILFTNGGFIVILFLIVYSRVKIKREQKKLSTIVKT